jgi:Ca2+/Na+ antiporter
MVLLLYFQSYDIINSTSDNSEHPAPLRSAQIVLGNVIGSNIFNILLILGVSA